MVMDMNRKIPKTALIRHTVPATALLLTLVAQPAAADFKDFLNTITNNSPKIEIPINHPPGLPLKVTGVALAPPEGRCSDPLASRIEEDFVNAGITVIDREHLNSVLTEHKLQVSGLIDQKTAARVGQLLGAQALIFLKVMECGAAHGQTQQAILVNNRPVIDYAAEGTVSGSMRIIDLTSGRVLVAQHIEGKSHLQSRNGPPSDQDAVDQAERTAADSVHRMFFPWTETKSLAFFNDSTCGLSGAYNTLRTKDIDGALAKAQSGLEGCQKATNTKPAALAHAYYDVGILQFLQSNYDPALHNLEEAGKLDSNKIILDATADCRSAKTSSMALAKFEETQTAPQDSLASVTTPKGPKLLAQQPKPTSGASSSEDRLEQLEKLLKKKLITQDEYNQKRAKILSEM